MTPLLLDQNAPFAAASMLRDQGLDAVHARDLGLSRAPDIEILEAAALAGRVVVTHDADFSQLLALSGRTTPSVVHLRREFETNEEFVACVMAVLAVANDDLTTGAIASVDERSIRIRLLPVLGKPSAPS